MRLQKLKNELCLYQCCFVALRDQASMSIQEEQDYENGLLAEFTPLAVKCDPGFPNN